RGRFSVALAPDFLNPIGRRAVENGGVLRRDQRFEAVAEIREGGPVGRTLRLERREGAAGRCSHPLDLARRMADDETIAPRSDTALARNQRHRIWTDARPEFALP